MKVLTETRRMQLIRYLIFIYIILYYPLYMLQKTDTLRENLCLPPVYCGVRVAAHIASFLRCVVFNFVLFVRL